MKIKHRLSVIATVMLTIMLVVISIPTIVAANPPVDQQQETTRGDQYKQGNEDEGKSPPTPQDLDRIKGSSSEAFILVIVLIVLLVWLFYMLFVWSRKLEVQGFIGKIFKETIGGSEEERLAAPFKTKWAERGYHEGLRYSSWWLANPEPPLPRIGSNAWTSRVRRQRGTVLPGLTGDGDLSNEEMQECQEEEDIYRTWENNLDIEAKKLYMEDLAKVKMDADRQANRVLSDMDLSALRGYGPEFVMGFTAIVVIIFAAVMLGILGILKSEQIGTLLAAIAGYVLGRETTRPRRAEKAPEPEQQGKPDEEVKEPEPEQRGKPDEEVKVPNQ